jgi:hypothetical protein
MSSKQDQIFAVVRKSIVGYNADNLSDADVKSLIDFVQSDDTGVVILDDLLDTHQRSLGFERDDFDLPFKYKIPATADLVSFFKYCRFKLDAPDIDKQVVALLKAYPPNKGPEHSE